MRACDQSPQPRTGPTARIEKPDGFRPGGPQVSQFCVEYGPDPSIRIGMCSVKGKRLRRITVGIRNVIVTGLIVDVGDVI
ncbi:hypothetical protein BJ6T_31950 [Bradyrhizobium japonicum USDA 6]|nr:hypothetical protein BJ6T_31950 [Bradyrhizobium japonicum USDA 6]